MSARDIRLLGHIKESVERIDRYTAAGETSFLRSQLHQDAVLHRLAVIGEAAKSISDELKFASPQVPWRGMARLRDVIVHDIAVVDLDQIWEISQSHVAELEPMVLELLATTAND
ncbi:MAG: HepT-like ribonuclease domain-containing protein [Dehalococcoidia bacterium]